MKKEAPIMKINDHGDIMFSVNNGGYMDISGFSDMFTDEAYKEIKRKSKKHVEFTLQTINGFFLITPDKDGNVIGIVRPHLNGLKFNDWRACLSKLGPKKLQKLSDSLAVLNLRMIPGNKVVFGQSTSLKYLIFLKQLGLNKTIDEDHPIIKTLSLNAVGSLTLNGKLITKAALLKLNNYAVSITPEGCLYG